MAKIERGKIVEASWSRAQYAFIEQGAGRGGRAEVIRPLGHGALAVCRIRFAPILAQEMESAVQADDFACHGGRVGQ